MFRRSGLSRLSNARKKRREKKQKEKKRIEEEGSTTIQHVTLLLYLPRENRAVSDNEFRGSYKPHTPRTHTHTHTRRVKERAESTHNTQHSTAQHTGD